MKEITWIDWVKFLCIFFVYWCHVRMFSDAGCPVYMPYGPFFVNAFFFVSGYLIFRKQLSKPIISSDKRVFLSDSIKKNGMLTNILFKIAIPSILFSMIDFVPKTLIRGEGLTLDTFVIDTFVRGTQWFTCALCVSELLIVMMLVTRFRNIWYYFALTLPFVVLGYYLHLNKVQIFGDDYLPWFYKSGLMALYFLVCGGLYHQYESRIDSVISKVGGGIFSVVTVVAYYLIMYFTAVGSWKVSVLEGIEWKGLILSLVAIFVLVYMCKFFKSFKLVTYISRHSIGFYFLSASIPFVCCNITDKILSIGSLGFFISFIGSFLAAFVVVYLLNRFVPFVFDLRKLWQ